MAVAAHFVGGLSLARPPPGMWVSTGSSDLVAPDAVCLWSGIVTPGARNEVASRGTPMKVTGFWIATGPTGRVWVAAADDISAHPLLDVTRVAVLGRMTTDATCWLGARLKRVTYEKVAPMHHIVLDRIGTLLLHRERRTQIVAGLTICLGMAGLAQRFLRLGEVSVPSEEGRVVL